MQLTWHVEHSLVISRDLSLRESHPLRASINGLTLQPPLSDTGDTLNVALIVDDTEAEGPGRRMAIWVQGCPFRCPECCNPEMLDDKQMTLIPVSEIAVRLAASDVEGVSFLGGEPTQQSKAVANLAQLTQKQGKTVMVFSGYRLTELQERQDNDVDALLAATDLLVDDRYDEKRRSSQRRWIGSENQTLHFLTDRYSPEDPCFHAANTVEIRMVGSTITLNGWPVDGRKTFPVVSPRRARGDASDVGTKRRDDESSEGRNK